MDLVAALGREEPDAMAMAGEEEPTGLIRVGSPPPELLAAASPPRASAMSTGDVRSAYTDWPEPPSLPAPPEQFAPPEMTLPPRLPDAVARREERSAQGSEVGLTSGLVFAAELGSPELPDLTPSDVPKALGRRLEGARPGPPHRVSDSDRGESGLGVMSQVVEVPLGVMRPGEGDPPTAASFPPEGSLPEEPSLDGEFPTAVWSTGAPPQAQPTVPPPVEGLRRHAAGGGAPGVAPRVARPSGPGQDLIAGRYRVIERIGQGGMARIFRVKHIELGKDFALKIIHSALSGDAKVEEMFYQEARLASSLDHPNIVLLTDFGVDARFGAFIVMEYLKGETLHARLRREKKLHQNVACEIALQVAEALQFIHGKDVVHCDIKSENVFLCDPPVEQRRRTIVKLLDFGLSRQKIASGRVSLSEVGGTPAYMAPERINRLSPRPSMDIYSLGILLYEMLSGTLPFNGTVEETLLAQLKDPPEPLSRRILDPPDDRLEALVMRALAKAPQERQKDMAALVYELRTVMDMLGLGRRRGRAKAAPRGPLPARARDCELLVADCPLPLFMTDLKGLLVQVNPAFASFVNLTVEQAAGTPLADTRLGRLCPEILEDLRKTLKTRKPTQRMLSFPWRSEGRVSMMIWLVPGIVAQQPVGVIGVVHPFSSSSAPVPAPAR